MTKRSLRNTAIPIIAIAIFAVVFWNQAKQPSRSEYRIGVIVARSGPASYIGEPEARALEALINQGPYSNGIPNFGKVKLVIRDSGGKPDQAQQIFDQFASDSNIVAVIGPSTSGEAIPLAKRAKEHGLPLLALAASKKIVDDPDDPSKVNKWAFKFAQNDDLAAERLILEVSKRKPGAKVGFLYSADGFGKSGWEAFSATVTASPLINLAFDSSFPKEMLNAEPIVRSIPENLDAIVIWGTSPGPALLVKSLKVSRPSLPIYLSHGNAAHDFAASVGIAGQGVTIVGSRVLVSDVQLIEKDERDEVIKTFHAFWSSHSAEPVSQFSGYARDALEASIVALTGMKIPGREGFRDALEKWSGTPSVTGHFRFSQTNHAGLDITAFEVFQIRDGRLVLVDSEARR